MPNYTTNLNLEKPLADEQYNIDVFNANADKIDQFAGQTPARALTADKLTTGAKINGVNFKGDADIVTGAGFYYDTVTYGAGDLAFIYNQDGKLELYKSLSAGNVGHNPLTSTGYWEKQDLGGNGYEVGDFVWRSLPTQDSDKHLADGTRLSGDGIYKDFVNHIADLYNENPDANYFTTETTWQASVTQYGSCGKFVYDSELNTVRLPKVSDILQGTTDVNALGDLVEAGLPNIAASTTMVISNRAYPATGAFSWSGAQRKQNTAEGGSYWQEGTMNYSASRSSSLYKNNFNKVQPQTIKALLYIVVATSTKTDIQVDIDNIATDLNGKADVDLTNTTDQAKILMGSMASPSDTKFIELSLGATGATYTAPANGYVFFVKRAGRADEYATLGSTMIATTNTGNWVGAWVNVYLPIKKNDTFYLSYNLTGELSTFRFVPAAGSESEVS